MAMAMARDKQRVKRRTVRPWRAQTTSGANGDIAQRQRDVQGCTDDPNDACRDAQTVTTRAWIAQATATCAGSAQTTNNACRDCTNNVCREGTDEGDVCTDCTYDAEAPGEGGGACVHDTTSLPSNNLANTHGHVNLTCALRSRG
jgi:hypothetical protein